jgi:transposase
MDGGEWRPARWTPGQLEERRLAAAALLRRGRLTQAAVARRLGVSRTSVSRWAAALRRRGRRGLRAQPKAGRPPRLDARAWARLGRLLARGALAAGFETERWTLRRIAAPSLRRSWQCPEPGASSACATTRATSRGR